jgi:hypothetical protein
LLFTPVFALAYLDPAEESPTFLIDAIRTAMNPPLGFASVDTVYRTFGLWYIVATTLMFVGFVALRAHLRPLLAGRGSRWLMITSIGWGMLLVGLVGNYGIGEALSSGIHMLAFLVEMVGGLLLLLGLLMVGIGLQRSTTIPVWISWSPDCRVTARHRWSHPAWLPSIRPHAWTQNCLGHCGIRTVERTFGFRSSRNDPSDLVFIT